MYDNYAGERDPKGRYHGHGTMTYGRDSEENAKRGVANGDVYSGNWKHGKRDGQGILSAYIEWDGTAGHYIGALSYDGSWKNDKHDGYGVETYNDNRHAPELRYEGDHKNGFRDGKGEEHYPGTVQLSSDHPDYEQKRFYKGEFHRGAWQGHGVMKYANGDVYKGRWENNERQGHGS